MSEASAALHAYQRQDWREVHRLLSEAGVHDLHALDLERLATASYLIGEDDDSIDAWEQAHRVHLSAGEDAEAGRCGFWAALLLMLRGQMAQAGGWLGRTEGVIGDRECAAAGYLLIPALLGALDGGDPGSARDLAVRAGEIAARFGDHDLAAFSTLGHGQALLAMGEQAAGLGRLDEVMLSVRSEEVGPITAGIVYCAVILECMQVFDLARATEWTAALDEWCTAQPDLVPYRGQCLVHQSQIQQAAGEWSTAASTVAAARDRLSDPPHPALGLACYQQAELHRLLGDYDAAERAYGQASRAGHEPMPGMALLELARGNPGAAAASIRRSLAEADQPFRRPSLLAAAVEILLEARDVEDARSCAEELSAIAEESSSEMLAAMARQATGSVLLASGDPLDSLVALRDAQRTWLRLQMPYEAARVGVELAQACLAVDDSSSAKLELDNARSTFAALGAEADLTRLAAVGGEQARTDGGLSKRELEVLAEVAAGRTNREIAEELSISQHTVGRHLENIFAKLGVASRAAATAHAYEHGLL